MPQQKALQRDSNSSNGQSRLCGVKIMSFPNGELCVKRTGVGGKGTVSHTEEAYNWCLCPVCLRLRVCVCVCGAQAGKRKGDSERVCERAHIYQHQEAPSL